MIAKEITVKATFSKENVQEVITIYKDITGDEPSERWVRKFLTNWVNGEAGDAGGTFTDDLYDVIAESVSDG